MGIFQSSLGRFVPKSAFARSVAMLSAGSFASQALMALATPIATRFYTPADYGVLGVFTAILSVLLIVAGGRYELAVTIPEDDQSAANLLGLAFLMMLCTATLAAMAIWLFGASFLAWIKGSALTPFFWLIPVSIVGDGAYQCLSYWAVRTKCFGDLAKTKFNQAIASNTTILGLGFLHAGPVGLLLGQYVSNSAGITTLARPLVRNYRKELKLIRWGDMWALAKRHRKFPIMSAPSALLNSAAFFLPPVLLSAFYGTETSGLFSLAMRIVGIPATLVGAAVTQVYLGESADTARNNREKLAEMFDSVTRKLLRLSVLVVAFGCVSPYIFGFVFGESWRMAGLYAAFLSVHAAAQIVVSPISTIAIVLERQDLQMIGDLIRCVLVALALYLPHRLGCSAEVTVATYALTMALTYVGFYAMYRWVAFSTQRPATEVTQ